MGKIPIYSKMNKNKHLIAGGLYMCHEEMWHMYYVRLDSFIVSTQCFYMISIRSSALFGCNCVSNLVSALWILICGVFRVWGTALPLPRRLKTHDAHFFCLTIFFVRVAWMWVLVECLVFWRCQVNAFCSLPFGIARISNFAVRASLTAII